MNSRLKISNSDDVATLTEQLSKQADAEGTRALIIVCETPENWLAQLAKQCVGTYLEPESNIDRADRIAALLGSECTRAFIQLAHIPDLGLLAALAGTLKVGGVLIIGTSARNPKALNERDSVASASDISKPSHSTQRIKQLAVTLSEQHADSIKCLQVEASLDVNSDKLRPAENQWAKSEGRAVHAMHDGANEEQIGLLTQACDHLATHSTSLIVISGRRGRGKSTLMARIALNLWRNDTAFHVTAMHQSALQAFNAHASEVSNCFISPEAAANECADILFVDEAASFSLTLLQRYAERCRHLILCSTTEGYEASGRALDVRLLSSSLFHNERPLLRLNPLLPWRWNQQDALEQFINQLLLKRDTSDTVQGVIDRYENLQSAARHCQLRSITQQELASDEALLGELHALLSATHYQTTTKDLEHLLDAQSLRIWVQMLENRVVGVLLLEEEGQLPPSLHELIVTKKRRLKNQLLPQLLAQLANDGSAMHLQYARVIRVAVAPKMRRLGLASAMLSRVVDLGCSTLDVPESRSANTFDAIGASFASDACSIAFWQSHGFEEFHRGFRSNPRTGKQAVAVLRCFDPISEKVLKEAVDIHIDNERYRKTESQIQQKNTDNVKNEERDRKLLDRFANGQRSLHDTFAAVQRLSAQHPLPIDKNPNKSTKQYELELRAHVKQSLYKQTDKSQPD